MTTTTTVPPIVECKHCTVPATGDDGLCSFCRTYVPPATPAQQLDVATNRIDLLRRDLNAVLRELPTDSPLFAAVELVTGLCHLKRAAVALDRAAALVDAAEAVQR